MKTAKLGVWAAGLLVGTVASASNFMSYDFNGDLRDSHGSGLPLVSLGGSLTTFGRYSFGINEGLTLSGALPDTGDYTIEIKFQVNKPASGTWNKLLDFQNRSVDAGLYVFGPPPRDALGIQFYPATDNGPTTMPPDTDVLVQLTRNALTMEVSARLNGVLQWSFVDADELAVPAANLLTFFADDLETSGEEAFVGSVDYIRIGGGTGVPEPGLPVLFGLGLAGLGLSMRRQARARGRCPIRDSPLLANGKRTVR